jgi:hypothetical protein
MQCVWNKISLSMQMTDSTEFRRQQAEMQEMRGFLENTMTEKKQPEALRLASTTTSLRGWKWADDCEAELRRQHALIEELREALAWYVEEDDVVEDMPGNEPWVAGKRRAQAALAKAEAQS